MSVERLEASITGYVQGVGFRWFVVRHATRLRLTGWVANQADGSVRAVVEGSPDAVAQLEALLHAGPGGASVSNVDVVRMPATGEFVAFGIRSAGHRGD